MAKEKLTLNELKVQSFVTSLDAGEMSQLKGGVYTIRGRKYNYHTRWTTVDTRSDEAEAIAQSGTKGL